MTTLNKGAAELARDYRVHACTDITGFGLLGHLCEMIDHTALGLRLDVDAVPLLPEVRRYAENGLVPGGTKRNFDFRRERIRGSDLDLTTLNILFDPQTSGGLLFCLPADEAPRFVTALHDKGIDAAAVIGEVVDDQLECITLQQASRLG
jgi:selenide,water dikinase